LYSANIENTPFSLSARDVRMVYAAMMAATALSALNASTVGTALTTIVGDLGGIRAYTWVSTSYMLTSTVVTPLFGKFSDLYGRKPLIQLSIVVFLLGSVMCALAPSMTMLVIARAIQGIGSGGIQAMSFVVIADIVSPRDRGKYVGAFTSIWAITSVAGPLVGGLIVATASWRWIFLVNLPFGVLALVMIHRFLHLPTIRRDTKIDTLGATLLTGGVASMILTISWISEEYGWSSLPTVAMLCATIALLSGFLVWEPHAVNPMLPLHLFKNHTIQRVVPMVTLVAATMSLVGSFMPLFLQSVTGVSPTNSGLLLVPMMIGLTLSSFYVGRWTTKTGRYRIYPIVGTAFLIVGLAMLTLIEDSGRGIMFAMVGTMFIGICTGASMPVSTTAIQNSVDVQDMGVATSLSVLCRSLGSTISLAAFGSLLNAQVLGKVKDEYIQKPRLINALPEPARTETITVVSDAIVLIYQLAVPLAIIAFVFAYAVKEIPLRTHAAWQDASVKAAEVSPGDGNPAD
jgi:EmrB/QacA subfamily drug resistance transporter